MRDDSKLIGLETHAAYDGPVLALGQYAAVTVAPTAGIPLFARCPPVHTVILGRCALELRGKVHQTAAMTLPPGTPHKILAFEGPHAGAVYLDPRRYSLRDAQQLGELWRGFVPGRDDVREAMDDALRRPRRKVDARLLHMLEALDTEGLSVAEAAQRTGLSESRATHLMSETLGAPPRQWRTWLRLRRAIGESIFGRANLTQAAHRAGFVDSAHLTRTCKQMMGVRPGEMMPRTVHVMGLD